MGLSEADFSTENVWSSLEAAQIQAGGKLGVYSEWGSTFSVAVLRTVYAVNNPSDTLIITMGMGWFWSDGHPWRRRPAGYIH